MKRLGNLMMIGIASMALLSLTGCDRQVGYEREVDVKDDGTVKTKEKTVTQHPDGSTTVTEEKQTTKP